MAAIVLSFILYQTKDSSKRRMLRVRQLLRMAEETTAKRFKLSAPLIGTHNGHFHADEALAVYLLRLLPEYSSSPLIRTRDPAQLAACRIVVDVGGVYDPTTHRYDHHQRTFQATFPQHSTKLSSAGLIYLHFGKAIIAQHTSLPLDHNDVATMYEKLYADFIEALDAHDNGISVYDPAALAASGLQKRFRDGGINLGALVGDMNQPNPASQVTDPQDEDSLFAKASSFIGETFLRRLRFVSESWLPARRTVSIAFRSRFTIHPSGRIMLLPKAGIPWKEHLYTLEEGERSRSDSESLLPTEVYYVLYPESPADQSKWRVQCVPLNDASFESRKPLPETWRGVRDEDLDGVLAAETESRGIARVPDGAIFVHASGFIGGHKTEEGAMAMALMSLDRT